MPNHKLTLTVSALALLTAGGALISFSDETGLAKAENAPDIVNGQRLYAENCASCHGASLQGQPDWQSQNPDGTLPAPPHDQTGHTWHHDDVLLFEYTKLGGAGALSKRGVANFNSGMPAFDEILSDQEILDVLAYIKSTWPRRVQEIQKSRSQGG